MRVKSYIEKTTVRPACVLTEVRDSANGQLCRLSVCAWCGTDGLAEFCAAEGFDEAGISHGICAQHREEQLELVRRENHMRRQAMKRTS